MGPVPVVILLHMLGAQENAMMGQFARYLARRQIAAVTMDLPSYPVFQKHWIEPKLGKYAKG